MDDQAVEEIKRYFGVVAEGLESQIRQVAEGHQTLVAGQDKILARVNEIEGSLGAMIKFSYAELDSRICRLENALGEIMQRVEQLEGCS